MKRQLWAGLTVLAIILTGCSGFPTGGKTPPAAGLTPSSASAQTPGSDQGTALQNTPESSATPENTLILTVWLPKEFDPASGTAAGDLLNHRLKAFVDQNPGLTVNVRIKAATGPASLLDSLTASSSAAPDALPDLIALPRPDLEVAALKGLLTSLDGLTSLTDDPDWYEYARQLGLVQNSTFGLAFAGDALVLLYRPTYVSKPPVDWKTLLEQSGPMAFPAADRQALFTLALYRGEGGELEDAQGRPALAAEPLANVLNLYRLGMQENLFPYWVGQLESDEQVWQAYQDQRANIVVTWVSRYLANLPPDTVAQPLPASSQSGATLATGWMWAVGNPDPGRQALSVKLAEFLVESDFLAQWSQAAGVLPTRPAALASLSDQGMQAFLSQVVVSAQARPKTDLIVSLGPVLEDASLAVLKGEADPAEAAQAASDQLKGQ